MSYEKVLWTDHIIERPRTYTMKQNEDGTITLSPAYGATIQQGTPLNAENLNRMEAGIEKAIQDAATGISNASAAHETAKKKAERHFFTATLAASGWSSSAPYTQSAAVEGVLATDNPVIDLDMSSATTSNAADLQEAWSFVGRIVAEENKITAYCYEDKPGVDLNINMLVVR